MCLHMIYIIACSKNILRSGLYYVFQRQLHQAEPSHSPCIELQRTLQVSGATQMQGEH